MTLRTGETPITTVADRRTFNNLTNPNSKDDKCMQLKGQYWNVDLMLHFDITRVTRGNIEVSARRSTVKNQLEMDCLVSFETNASLLLSHYFSVK